MFSRYGVRVGPRRALAPMLAFVLALSSCGRAPTAPGASMPGPSRAAIPTDAEVTDDVAVLLVAGANGETVSADYGATSLPGSNETCMRLRPPSGETCEGLAARMFGDPRVVIAERNVIAETAETRQESFASDDGNGTEQSYLEQPAAEAVGLRQAHQVSRGQGILIAVLDTGVDPAHPAFQGRLVGGYDFIELDADPTDRVNGLDDDGDTRIDEAYGHGTHVAGIVALTAPGASIMPVRVLDADGRGNVATVAAGIRYAIDHGAQVLSLSLGMLRNSEAIQDMIETAEEGGVIVVASAGNWGAEVPREYPASSSHARAIGSSDASARPASFTSYGEHLELCAPGVGVRSAYPGGGWRLWSGTSMSVPFVSGTVALLLAVHAEWGGEAVFERIEQSARPLTNVAPDQVGKLGHGMLDAGAALLPDLAAAKGVAAPDPADPLERRR